MTTYGPTTLTLAERLRGADLVARIVGAELVRTTVDELSESRREHGTFVLTLAERFRGDASETVEVLVARGPDEPWPIPEKGEFLALLQGDGKAPFVLVHNSAFPLRGDTVQVDPAAGLPGDNAKAERVGLKEVVGVLAEQDARVVEYEKLLVERETSQVKPVDQPVQEMPGDGLREWLDLEHGEGGRAGQVSTVGDGPDDGPREPEVKRRPTRGLRKPKT